jgi:hypothetical protein
MEVIETQDAVLINFVDGVGRCGQVCDKWASLSSREGMANPSGGWRCPSSTRNGYSIYEDWSNSTYMVTTEVCCTCWTRDKKISGQRCTSQFKRYVHHQSDGRTKGDGYVPRTQSSILYHTKPLTRKKIANDIYQHEWCPPPQRTPDDSSCEQSIIMARAAQLYTKAAKEMETLLVQGGGIYFQQQVEQDHPQRKESQVIVLLEDSLNNIVALSQCTYDRRTITRPPNWQLSTSCRSTLTMLRLSCEQLKPLCWILLLPWRKPLEAIHNQRSRTRTLRRRKSSNVLKYNSNGSSRNTNKRQKKCLGTNSRPRRRQLRSRIIPRRTKILGTRKNWQNIKLIPPRGVLNKNLWLETTNVRNQLLFPPAPAKTTLRIGEPKVTSSCSRLLFPCSLLCCIFDYMVLESLKWGFLQMQ